MTKTDTTLALNLRETRLKLSINDDQRSHGGLIAMKPYLFIVISVLASNITYAAVPPNTAKPDVTTLAQNYMASHDSNGDGRISIDEYQDWAAIHQRTPKLASMALKWFDEADTNHDGYLDEREVHADLENLANQ